MARKGAKSRTRISGLRSKRTKPKTPVDRLRAANADLNNADLKKRIRRGAGAADSYCRDFRDNFQLSDRRAAGI